MTTESELTAPDVTFAVEGELAANMTTLVTGIGDGISPVWIALPGSGLMQIVYEYQDRPAPVFLWHQGGATQPIQPGFGTYNTLPGDYIMYSLAYLGQSIKLGWAYL